VVQTETNSLSDTITLTQSCFCFSPLSLLSNEWGGSSFIRR